ncbi:hypothetical protein AB0D12_31725 [Streptomyces sp. NPDC048479]|uniref:hypothetical protein n=1 Tax=Streptomyces sp. NPDC048479 TaxID=3154725 RepID=UPI00342C98F0
MGRMGGAGRGVVAVVAIGVLAVGCSSGDSEPDAKPKSSASASVMSVGEAMDAYTAASAPGCTTAPECQQLVTDQLAAAVQVRTAMQAKDPAAYAEPIRMVSLAEERADHYGRDNLGAKGNSFAVSQPLQQMVAWFREHPGS